MFRLFAIKCNRCDKTLANTDLVMTAKDAVYHVSCFRCYICDAHMVAGDKFKLEEKGLVCSDHYIDDDRDQGSDISLNSMSSETESKVEIKSKKNYFSFEFANNVSHIQ